MVEHSMTRHRDGAADHARAPPWMATTRALDSQIRSWPGCSPANCPTVT